MGLARARDGSSDIALLLFDFDDVLARYDRGRRCASLAAATGTTPGQVAAALFESGLETAYDSGQVETGAYLDRLGAALGAKVDAQMWIASRVAGNTANEDVLALAAGLTHRVQIGVLTNNGALLADAARSIVAPLYPALDGNVLCSGVLAVRKPDPLAYRLTIRHFGVNADRVLFVDDLLPNVQGARRAGLHAEQVTDATSLARALEVHGLA